MDNSSMFPKGQLLPKDWFSGTAFLTSLIARDANNEFTVASITFEPMARTNWHTHPKGQILIVIEGTGFYQEKDCPAQPIQKGDVINIPENIVHWHGASSKSKMVHIAITNFKNETQVTWLEPVTDTEYEKVNIFQ